MPQRDKPLVSIIGSVYNGEQHLAETLESLRAQDYSNFEVIIVNDASTDDSLSIIESYCLEDERFRFITNTNNEGPAAKNKAIEAAKGEFIAVFDADDIYAKSRISEQVKFMEKRPELLASSCQAIKFEGQQGLLWNYLSPSLLKAFAFINMPLVHPSIIYRASVFKELNLRYDAPIRFVQDYDLVFRLSQQGAIANQAKVLMLYRRHDTQVTSGEKMSYVQRAYDHLYQLKSRQLGQLINDLNKKQIDLFIAFCFNDLESVDITEMENFLLKIVRAYPDSNSMGKVVAQHRLHQLKKSGIAHLFKHSMNSPILSLRDVFAYLNKEVMKKLFMHTKAKRYI
ncbi:MAG: glycosyltransferase [Bacteroidia bacterium]